MKQCEKCGMPSQTLAEILMRGPNGYRRYKVCPKCAPANQKPKPGVHFLEDPDQVCTRCGYEKIMMYMKHTRLNGYTCVCGNQEWKPRPKNQPSDIEYMPSLGYIPKIKHD